MNRYDNAQRLTLVGAGPGDPELITLKGIKALQSADAVLYDALVDPALLEYVPGHAPCVFTGKRAGRHHIRQEGINRMIVEYAYAYGHVVRLKGGDPFIFGRGHEEKRHAERHGIAVTAVPAPSSATALATAAGLPLTRRGYSQSIWTVTATTREGGLSGDIALAAQSSATVVILMGLRKLEEIMATFVGCGKAALPVAVVQNGTLETERWLRGTAADIAGKVRDEAIGGPAVIIAGEVVGLLDEAQTHALAFDALPTEALRYPSVA
jgi:uroporphyrin-III C-methyltransferase